MAKPFFDRFAVCVATTNPERAADCFTSWTSLSAYQWPIYVAWNGGDVSKARLETAFKPLAPHRVLVYTDHEPIGTVPAYARLTRHAWAEGREILCCLHDDVLIEEPEWDLKILSLFDQNHNLGLAGFGGGRSLGCASIYQVPYDPMQLARGDFVSNMREAEAHGRRIRTAQRVACLDGFSQIGRASFLTHAFQYIANQGVIHHAYDSWLGALAKREGWQVWCCPIACHHFGGRTAVADGEYHRWAQSKNSEGDHGFWLDAHRAFYEDCRDVLPIGAVE